MKRQTLQAILVMLLNNFKGNMNCQPAECEWPLSYRRYCRFLKFLLLLKVCKCHIFSFHTRALQFATCFHERRALLKIKECRVHKHKSTKVLCKEFQCMLLDMQVQYLYKPQLKFHKISSSTSVGLNSKQIS